MKGVSKWWRWRSFYVKICWIHW